ncbi:Cilia- and flagella-associated protein 91 [Kappamyces sp. JEL0829]|nr:Cilia- and flagella-associated protein 91 [Kappamyces sp. JEL0829]
MAALTQAHTGVMPNRPHDYIYDSTFTVSSRKDHVKQMTRSQAQQVIINPHFDNMFSALRHFPPMQYRLKMNPFPSGIGQDRRTVVEHHAVSGQNRFKYFRRPIMPFQPVFSGQVIYAKKKQSDAVASVVKAPVATSKTVAVQTMYRVSETQTDPYSPDYIFKPNDPPPELLALASLSYGHGLPAGMAELEMIERARVKRVWEASLPIVTDQASFEKRLKMMEEMELKEWEERELEIKRLQEARLEVLEQVIRQRERENDLENDKRVERIWQRKMQEREALFEKINRKRIKSLRKLADQRARIDNKVEKRDIIAEYGNYASRVYAPKAREGLCRDKAASTLQVKLEELDHYAGLAHLEMSLPKSVLEPRIERAVGNDKSPEARREKVLKEQLEKMNEKMVQRKERQNQVKPPLKYAVRIEKPPVRPSTPSIVIPSEETEEMEIAAHLLQNLIRGRAAQQDVYKRKHQTLIVHVEKERRLELINELRARRVLRDIHREETAREPQGDTSILVKHLDERGISFESAVQAEYVGKTLDFLTKQLVRLREERRIAAMVKLAERTRKMREAEESGARQQELIRQAEQDIIFRQVMSVHQETVDTYLEQVIASSVQETAKSQAQRQAQEYYLEMDQLRSTQTQPPSDEQMVSDLITSFLIPYVERQVTRGMVETNQEQFLLAAHQAVYQHLDTVERSVLPLIETMSLQDSPAAVETAPGVSDTAEAVEKLDTSLLPPLPNAPHAP